eukprot:m51a1_g11804 hypothetical protein (123) ;mRNA; r:345110-345478
MGLSIPVDQLFAADRPEPQTEDEWDAFTLADMLRDNGRGARKVVGAYMQCLLDQGHTERVIALLALLGRMGERVVFDVQELRAALALPEASGGCARISDGASSCGGCKNCGTGSIDIEDISF